VAILFSLTYRPVVSSTFFVRPKTHFSINLRQSAIIPLYGRGEHLVDANLAFYLFQALHMFNLYRFRYFKTLQPYLKSSSHFLHSPRSCLCLLLIRRG
jgi:hypothetical protein